MTHDISDFHESEMKKMKLPNWITQIKCPFCNKELPLRSVRSIRLCLNTRNFGEIAIEILCDECSKLDSVYLRENISELSDFISLLNGKQPLTEPVIEEAMYKMQYNNIVNKLCAKGTV